MADPSLSETTAVRPDDAEELFCPSCGYNLRGIQSSQCPECGLVIDRQTISRSSIPWTHRQQIGRWRAFWRTVWQAGRYPGMLARDAARPVSYTDAQRFRWTVVLVATTPLAIAMLLARYWIGNDAAAAVRQIVWGGAGGWPITQLSPWSDPIVCWSIGSMIWPVPTIALLLFLGSISGVSSYFYQPQSLSIVRQNRAIALSYYGCAPLSLVWLPVLLIGTAVSMQVLELNRHFAGYQIFAVLLIVGLASILGILFACWFSTLKILKGSTHCSTTRLVTAGVSLPLIWFVLALLTLFAFPAVCGFVRLFIASYSQVPAAALSAVAG